ncbi:MAG: hypothetical protein OEW02_02760 [Myxococcales bacterium]|nr:hypothetical protein [Myxococcales bacterium]
MLERPKLGELLLGARAITEAQLEAALAEQRRCGSPLGATVVRMGFLDEETLVRTLARQLKLPLAWLRGRRVKPEVLALVPVELATQQRCMPLAAHEEAGGRVLFLAMQDPADRSAIDEVSARVGCTIKPVLVAPRELDEALARHYPGAAGGRAHQTLELDDAIEPGEPDFLILDREARLAGSDATQRFDFLREPAAPPSHGILFALEELVTALVEKGMFRKADLIERLGGVERR